MFGSILFAIVIICLSLIILIGFHEFGHYLVAKLSGIKVIRFALGFGKPLFIKTSRSGTEYALCSLPLGGYVKLLDTRESAVSPIDLPYAYDKQPLYKRAFVIIAGPLFNIILALLFYWLAFCIGITEPIPIINNVIPESPAALGGLPNNTEIVAIDNKPTTTWTAVMLNLITHLGESGIVKITIKNNQQQLSSYDIPLNNFQINPLRPNILSSIGIQPFKPQAHTPWPKDKLRTRQFSLLKAFPQAISEINFYWDLNVIILWKMLTGIISLKSLVGPLGLLAGTVHAAELGFVVYITFIGFISLSLGFINLLPIPGLDGSHLIYLFIEALRGKPVSMAVQVLLFRLGFIILSVLMIQAITNDLLRLT